MECENCGKIDLKVRKETPMDTILSTIWQLLVRLWKGFLKLVRRILGVLFTLFVLALLKFLFEVGIILWLVKLLLLKDGG
jgi:hypothetical protein